MNVCSYARVVDSFNAVLVVNSTRCVTELSTSLVQVQRDELVGRILLELMQSRAV